MTLKFAIEITGDASKLKVEAGEGKAAIADLAQAATKGSADVAKLDTSLDAAAGAASKATASVASAAQAQGRAITTISSSAGVASTVLRQTGESAGLASHQILNLTRQGNDMATMWALGAPPMQIFASQAGQLYDAIASGPGGLAGGLKALGTSLLGSITTLSTFLTPLRILTIGLTAAGAAAVIFGRTTKTEVEPLDEILKKHAETVRRLKDAYGTAASGVREYVQESQGVAKFLAAQQAETLQKSYVSAITQTKGGGIAGFFQNEVPREFARPTGLGEYYEQIERGSPFLRPTQEARQFREPLMKLLEGVRSGKPDVVAFQEAIAKIADESNDPKLRELAAKMIGLVDEAAKGQRAFEALGGAVEDMAEKLRGVRIGESMSALRGFVPDTRSMRDQINEAADKASTDARSYGELMEIERQRKAGLDELTRQEDVARRGRELDIQAVSARTAAERALIAAERERLALSDPANQSPDRQKEITERANSASALVLAEASRSASDALRSSTDGRAAAGLTGYATQLAAINAQYDREIELAAGSADAVRDLTRARQLDIEALQIETRKSLFEGQEERLRSLSVEASLIGSTDDARRRALSALEAENDLRRAGIAATSEAGRSYLDNARELDAFGEAIRRNGDAWSTWQKGAESAIDGAVDKLSDGDLKGALDDVGKALTKSVVELSVTNPLKNALLGTSYGTVSDLFSDKPKAPDLALGGALGGLGSSAQNALWVQFAGAGAAAGALGSESPVERRALAPLNDNTKGNFDLSSVSDKAVARTLRLHPERAAVAQYYADGALARGLNPEITLRGLNQESGFNLNARNLTSREQSYGVAQLNTMGGLGAVALKQGINVRDNSTWRQQADFALDTMRKDGYRQWYGFRDVGIGRWDGMDRNASGNSAAKAVTKLGETSKALAGNASEFQANFASTLNDNLIGGMSSVVDQAVPGLGNVFSTLMRGLQSSFEGGGGFLSSLFGGSSISAGTVAAIKGGAAGLFADGGYTGHGGRNEPAGVVHRGEVVWSQNDISRAGGVAVVEAMRLGRRGYADGGVVGMSGPAPGAARSAGAAAAPSVKIIDQRGTGAPPIERRQTADEFGQPQLEMIIRDVVDDQVTRESSRTNRNLRQSYGLSKRLITR